MPPEQIDQGRVFVSLTRRNLKVNRTSAAITNEMDFTGKTAS
jgi:hypothetical protein